MVVSSVSDTEVGRGQREPSRHRARSSWRWSGLPAAPSVAVAILLVAAATWLVALPRLRAEPGGQYGLLATPGGALLLAAVTLAIIAFAASIAANRMFISGLSILLVILFERLTVTLITPIPIYTYTYKHIGVIEYIVKYRALPLPKVDVYNQWPGFFAAMSWFSSVAHVDPLDVGHWFTPLVDALIAVLVAALALALGFGMRVALTAAMLAQLLNWVGQDYFSPQAFALIMTISILVLLASSHEFPAAGYLSVPIFTALTATHQLTPVWLTALAVALARFRQIPRWLPAAYAVIEIVYVVPRYPYIKEYAWFSNPLGNLTASATMKVAGSGSDGRAFSIFVQRGLSASTWLLAAICFLVLWRRTGVPWVLGVMTASAVLMLGQSYGGECILRVFLYSLVGCSVLLATVLADALSHRENGRQVLAGIAASLVLITFAAAGLQSYFSWWPFVTITREELDESRRILATNNGGAIIAAVMAPAVGWPERPSADYVRFALVDPHYDRPLDEMNTELLNGPPKTEALDALERLANSKRSPIYLVLPQRIYAYDEYFGLFKPGTIPGLIDSLSHRPGWVRAVDDSDILEFEYKAPHMAFATVR